MILETEGLYNVEGLYLIHIEQKHTLAYLWCLSVVPRT